MRPRTIYCIIAGALSLAAMGTARQTAAAPAKHRALFQTSAQVYSGDEEDGRLWFSTWDLAARYSAAGLSAEQAAKLRRVLNTAIDAGRSVTIAYDGSGGRWNEEADRIEFPLCSVSVDELAFKSSRPCPQTADIDPDQDTRLALGHAEAQDGSAQAALLLLEPIIANSSGSPDFRKVALQSRARAFEALADHAPEGSRAADAALVLALSDLRRVAAAHPDDLEAQLSVANRLRDLGDYAGSEAEFRRVIARWPDEEERIGVSLALVARTRGDFQESLDILDGVVARHGRQEGMRFNYHRGWSLSRLGRYDEAIAALTEGIAAQPDYAWAYVYRACAYASLGRPEYALSDLETAIDLSAKAYFGEDTPAARRQRDEMASVRDKLATAVSARLSAPMTELCAVFGNDGEKPRYRSALIDASIEDLRREIAAIR